MDQRGALLSPVKPFCILVDESPYSTNLLVQPDPAGCKYVLSAAARPQLDDEHTTQYHLSDTFIIRKQVKCRLLRLWYVCLSRRSTAPLTPPPPATTAICHRRPTELGGAAQKR